MSGNRFINAGAQTPHCLKESKPRDFKRFFNKVKLNTNGQSGCWDWVGHRDRKGYGQFWFDGVAKWAHRWAYATFVGPIPEGETIDHICRNPGCVNPSHLRILSRSENATIAHVDRASEKEEEVPF